MYIVLMGCKILISKRASIIQCHELQVPSFAFISAQTAPGLSAILRGYVEGKNCFILRTTG